MVLQKILGKCSCLVLATSVQKLQLLSRFEMEAAVTAPASDPKQRIYALSPQEGAEGSARGAVSTHPRVHPSREWQHFHTAVCDCLHLHCQAACPGAAPGLCLFSLWLTPGKQKQSASECLFCRFMDDLCWMKSVFKIKSWMDICNKENTLTAFQVSPSKKF